MFFTFTPSTFGRCTKKAPLYDVENFECSFQLLRCTFGKFIISTFRVF